MTYQEPSAERLFFADLGKIVGGFVVLCVFSQIFSWLAAEPIRALLTAFALFGGLVVKVTGLTFKDAFAHPWQSLAIGGCITLHVAAFVWAAKWAGL